jgi:pyruvate dehydrogenase (quinone)
MSDKLNSNKVRKLLQVTTSLRKNYHQFECELLLLLGTDFPYFPFMLVHNEILQIDINPENLGCGAKLDFGLCGDIKETLTVLLTLMREKEDASFLNRQLVFHKIVENNFLYSVNDH